MGTKEPERSDGPPSMLAQPAQPAQPSENPGAPLWLVGSLYVTLILAPLGFAFVSQPVAPRAPVDFIASTLGMVAFAALMVEFLFSGRTRWISSRIGVRRTLRIHRWAAYAIISGIAIHPFLYTAPDGVSWPWFNADDPTLSLSHWSLATGLAAWILTAAIVFTAIDHKKLPGSYRTWRLMHAGSGIVLASLVAVHALSADGYSSHTGLGAYWILLLCAGTLTMIEMFLIQPLGPLLWKETPEAPREKVR